MTLHPPSSLAEVVENGLCIGCGLCAALSETLDMVLTEDGAERPAGQVTRAEEKRILAACPGAVIAAHIEEGAEVVRSGAPTNALSWPGLPNPMCGSRPRPAAC